MKTSRLLITFSLFLFACAKQGIDPNTPPACGNPGSGNAGEVRKKISSITAFIDGAPMSVTAMSFNRGTGDFNFSAWNNLQKVDVHCFWFYEQSGFNYQYSDSVNYSTRVDSLSNWNSTRAINYGTVLFDCCAGPLQDSVVNGSYSGDFSIGKVDLTVRGAFQLVFP